MSQVPNFNASSSFASSQDAMSKSLGALNNLGSNAASKLNYLLSNDHIRMFVMLVASVYAGYTLYPVPANLDKMFNESNVFKYFILFFGAVIALYPVNEHSLALCATGPILVLGFFELIRRHNKGMPFFKGLRIGKMSLCPDSEEKSRDRRKRKQLVHSESSCDSSCSSNSSSSAKKVVKKSK